MKHEPIRTYGLAVLWLFAYALAVTVPLLVTLLLPLPAPRGFVVEFGVFLGFFALSVMGLQFLLTGRFWKFGRPFGIDTILQFHRQIGLVALVLVLSHPLVLILGDSQFLSYFDPRVNLPRAVALTTALLATSLLIATSLWRSLFRLTYEWWRLAHAALASLVLLIGLAHVLQVGHYVDGAARRTLWSLFIATALCLLLYTRVVNLWRMRRRPWRVSDVRPERSDAVTIVLEAEGHGGSPFRAGQYFWITIGRTPWTMQQHPFSISSAASSARRIEFSIKPTGDFTNFVTGLTPGVQAYLEGPYGRFCLDGDAQASLFLMGGIGITPAMSILRTLRQQQDRRPHRLIYGNSNWDEIVFRDELEEMQQDLDLEILHVLSDPPDDWQGESGYIDESLLKRQLPNLPQQNMQYFVCGPEPMMDLVEGALLELGVPSWRIRAERFKMV